MRTWADFFSTKNTFWIRNQISRSVYICIKLSKPCEKYVAGTGKNFVFLSDIQNKYSKKCALKSIQNTTSCNSKVHVYLHATIVKLTFCYKEIILKIFHLGTETQKHVTTITVTLDLTGWQKHYFWILTICRLNSFTLDIFCTTYG